MEKKDWYKERRYLHIFNKQNNKPELLRKISNPGYVGRYAFFPLIFCAIEQRRYKRVGMDLKGKPKRSHRKHESDGSVVPTKKVRPILYASHLDAHIYAYYAHEKVSPVYERILKQHPGLSESVIAYRAIPSSIPDRNKCNIDFAHEVFTEIKRRGECIAMAFDVESFFNNLDHLQLKRKWCEVLGVDQLPKDHYNIFKSITRYSYFFLDDLKKGRGQFDEYRLSQLRKEGIHGFFKSIKEFNEAIREGEIIVRKNQYHNEKGQLRGIPQGLPISALLANVYMLDFDRYVVDELVKKEGIFYRRYSDDIVVVCRTDQRERVEEAICEKIKEYQLAISKDKTEISEFSFTEVGGKKRLQVYRVNKDNSRTMNVPFAYLGFEFYGYQILIKSTKIAAFYRRMKEAVRTRARRAEKIKERELLVEAPLFKRKIYRLFSYKGIKKRKLTRRVTKWERQPYGEYRPVTVYQDVPYRGNTLRYAERAAEIMGAPEILQQYRHHWKILQSTIQKYDFSNAKKKEVIKDK